MGKDKSNEIPKKNQQDIAKALEILFATDYIDKKKLYLNNFLRGIFFGAGSLLGATVLIGLLFWLLSVFNTVPLIGPAVENARQSVEDSQN